MTMAGTSRANGHTRSRPTPRPGKETMAAWEAIQRNTIRVPLPAGMGVLDLPSPQSLAFYAGLATIAAFGVIEWPLAAVLAAGHLLAEDHHHHLLHSFGEALSEA